MKKTKNFLSHFLIAIGAISAFIGAFSWLGNFCNLYQVIGIVGILLVGILYAIFQTIPSKHIELLINHSFPLCVEEGDIFTKKGVIVIPVNDFFDTIVDNKIIASNTIHGKFIETLFKGRIEELNLKIEKSLANITHYKEETNRNAGNKKRYPLGTCAVIKDGGNDYILVALATFDDNDKAYIPLKEYGSIIQKLVTKACIVSNNRPVYRPVYMPLLGSGIGGIKKSAQRILSYIISQVEFCSEESIPTGIHIIIYGLSEKRINLDGIKSAWEKQSII